MAFNHTPRAPRVCILTSGKGTRMGAALGVINKALLPLDRAALITHIIRQFPSNTHFVIALGHQGNQVQDYLALAHPTLDVTWVHVPRFEGPGSGPGLSLLACESHLQSPFFFVACDTLWTRPIPFESNENWVATAKVPDDQTRHYCNMEIRGTQVIQIHDKKSVQGDSYQAFTGLCFIKDTDAFWAGLRRTALIEGEHQISDGLRALIESKSLRTQAIDWIDVGDAKQYQSAVQRYEAFDFSKTNEFLYITGPRVIKFFADPTIIDRRVQRAAMNPSVFPSGMVQRGSFYAYDFTEGRTLYEVNSPTLFRKLLGWLDTQLWSTVSVDPNGFRQACESFYGTKTRERIAAYQKKYAIQDKSDTINGHRVPPLQELLDIVPWETLFQGRPVFFHGDLQFDNILYRSSEDRFTLLDWRHDFAGHIEFGDLRYDLAKLYGGILLNYDLIKKNLIRYQESPDSIEFDFAQRYLTPVYLQTLEEFSRAKGVDPATLRLLTAVIYLNMSPLHTYPFDKMLYSLGRSMLASEFGRLDS